MKKIFLTFFPLLLFIALTIGIFRPYFFSHKVLLPGNLLVAFYEPWKSYPTLNYPNGPANKPIGFDSLRTFFPFRVSTTEFLKKGHIPLWNPYTFSGNMYLAAYQTAVFSPVDLLFFVFPMLDAWSLMIILAPLLTAVGTYCFLRSLFLSKKASIIGALTFGFSGIVIALSEEWYVASYGILFLPFVFLSITKLKEKISGKYFLLLIVSFCGSILSGWFQITFYTFIFSTIWTIFLLSQDKKRRWIWYVLGGFLIALFICGIYLIPNIEAYFYSARSNTNAKYIFDMYLLPLSRLITYMAPDYWGNPATYNYFGDGFYQEKILYVGITGIFFGIYAFIRRKKLTKINTFFLIFWAIFLSLGFSLPTSWGLLYYLNIPLLRTILPSRIFILAAFCLSVACAYGFDLYWKDKNLKDTIASITPLWVLLVIGWAIIFLEKIIHVLGVYNHVALRNMILPTFFLMTLVLILLADILVLKRFRYLMYGVFLLFTIFPLFLFANKYLYFSERSFVFPKVPVLQKLQQIEGNDRMISFGQGYIEENLTAYYHLSSAEGYDPFFIERYGELIASTGNKGKLTHDIARGNVNFRIQGGTLEDIVANSYMMKVWSLLGIKYIIAKPNSIDEQFIVKDPQKHFSLLWTDGIYTIYKNNLSSPRSFLVSEIVTVQDSQKVLDVIYDPLTDLSKKVVLEKNVTNPGKQVNFTGASAITKYTAENIIIKTKSNENAFLILSDNYYPGWMAYVDGKQQEVLRADFSLRAVHVPKGEHEVVFIYNPFSVTVGWWMSGIGLVAIVIACWYMYRKKW